MLLIGNPSISMGHVYHGELLNNQMVYQVVSEFWVSLKMGTPERQKVWSFGAISQLVRFSSHRWIRWRPFFFKTSHGFSKLFAMFSWVFLIFLDVFLVLFLLGVVDLRHFACSTVPGFLRSGANWCWAHWIKEASRRASSPRCSLSQMAGWNWSTGSDTNQHRKTGNVIIIIIIIIILIIKIMMMIIIK